MRVILIVSLLLLSISVNGQVTDTIKLDFEKSIFLVFDSENISYKSGIEEELLFVEQFQNKVILQLGSMDFDHTNLFVECDNKIFMFIIENGDPGTKFVYDYSSKMKAVKGDSSASKSSAENDLESKSTDAILIRDTRKNDSIKERYRNVAEEMLRSDDNIFNRGVVKYKLGIYLRDLKIYNDKIFMEFEAQNKSSIDYVVDYYEYVIKTSKRRIKGESFQEVNLTPIMVHNRPEKFEGNSTVKYVLVFDKFVLTNGKKLVIEHWEDNGDDMNIEGGRKVDFNVFERDILNVKN